MTITLEIRPLAHFDPSLPLPAYQTPGAAGMDLSASLPPSERSAGMLLPSLGRVLVPTGLTIAIPEGFEGQIRPRSGLAARQGVTLVNTPGTIDSDYRGEIKVLMINLGTETWRLSHGTRIAQLVIAPVAQAIWRRVESLTTSARGEAGFGSTGQG